MNTIHAAYKALDSDGSTFESIGNGSGEGYNNSNSYPSDSYDDYSSNSEQKLNPDVTDDDNPSLETKDGHGKGTPKAPHDTSSYTQNRNGKPIHVRGYSTGKNREKQSPGIDTSNEE